MNFSTARWLGEGFSGISIHAQNGLENQLSDDWVTCDLNLFQAGYGRGVHKRRRIYGYNVCVCVCVHVCACVLPRTEIIQKKRGKLVFDFALFDILIHQIFDSSIKYQIRQARIKAAYFSFRNNFFSGCPTVVHLAKKTWSLHCASPLPHNCRKTQAIPNTRQGEWSLTALAPCAGSKGMQHRGRGYNPHKMTGGKSKGVKFTEKWKEDSKRRKMQQWKKWQNKMTLEIWMFSHYQWFQSFCLSDELCWGCISMVGGNGCRT